MEQQGAHEGGGRVWGRQAQPLPRGRPRGPRDRGRALRGGALPSRGRLGYFLTCTPSPLDHVRSKNHAPEGFIPFGLRLIFLFFEMLKQAIKQQYGLGLRLVG